MNLDQTLNRLSQKAHPVLILLAGLLILLFLNDQRLRFENEILELRDEQQTLETGKEQMTQTVREATTLRDSKSKELKKFKSTFSNVVQAKKSLYESGLFLQEEKRLLEKQLEIITTYLKADLSTKKISLMRGEQSLEDYAFQFGSISAFGGETKTLPAWVRITSKERFAHPERGKSEEVNGSLAWNPPQVGNSARSNALGEYVVFTNSPLILHGPPKKKEEHESFPHLCLGLPLQSAVKIYKNSFIGTKIAVKTEKSAKTPPNNE